MCIGLLKTLVVERLLVEAIGGEQSALNWLTPVLTVDGLQDSLYFGTDHLSLLLWVET